MKLVLLDGGSISSMKRIRIIGAGIAGSEAAWQCARRGVQVELWEMRPHTMPPAHRTSGFAELVCSNSFKSKDPHTSAGLLKEELRMLGSLILDCAEAEALPGGTALMVDRERFSARVTEAISCNPLIHVIRGSVDNIAEFAAESGNDPVIVAVGPNTTDNFWRSLDAFLGSERLHFFDATSPIVSADSLKFDRIFEASRYGKGENEGYLNSPMDKDEYVRFREELLSAELVPLGHGEELSLFEGCLPIEELARRGEDAMRFGPLKPVGFVDPVKGREPYAVVQLRQEDSMRAAYSLVGFQTRLKFPEQERVLSLIPGLEKAKFLRHGRMHKNTYIDAPKLLYPTLQYRANPNLLFAGQITGLEGYQSAAATGLVAGLNAVRIVSGAEPLRIPEKTVIGEALRWMTDFGNKEYRPTAPVFGMWKDVPKLKKKDRAEWFIRRSREGIAKIAADIAAKSETEFRYVDT